MLAEGKVPPEVLERAVLSQLRKLTTLSSCAEVSQKLVVGAGQGEDAAVLRLSQRIPDSSDNLIVVGSDPITGAGAPRMVGALAVYVNANDVLVQGGVPGWMTLTLLVPLGTTEKDLTEVVAGAVEAAAVLGLVIVGGHTEVTDSVRKIIASGTLLGPLHPKLEGRPVRTGGLRIGDSLLLTKSAALEGTYILLSDREEYLVGQGVFASSKDLEKALSTHPLEDISVHVEVLALLGAVAPHLSAMHDPTEGGIANALHEMVQAADSEVALCINADAIPLRQHTARLCKHFNIDPLTLISSGCVLAAVDVEHTDAAVAAVQDAGVACTVIGRVGSADQQKHRVMYSTGEAIEQPSQDALWDLLSRTEPYCQNWSPCGLCGIQ